MDCGRDAGAEALDQSSQRGEPCGSVRLTVPALALIDVTAVPADRAGVGRYVDELVTAFDRRVVIACQAEDAEHYAVIAPLATILPQPGIRRVWRRLVWEQFALPRIARRAGVGVIHSPHYTMPLLSHLTRVVTFHDATFFSDPRVHTRVKAVFFRAWIRLSSRLADAIVVPSTATASELGHYVRARRGRPIYDVVYHGVDASRFHPPTRAEVDTMAARLGIDGAPWIAFLGTIEPRKNIPALVVAYSDLVKSWMSEWGDVPTLVLAGADGWGESIDTVIDAIVAPARIKRVGYIELELVPALLGGALFVAYPSLGEGFGLPVLEAMASGSAVLTTRRLALPEVGGDAVAYAGVDSESLVHEMRRLMADPAERRRLGTLGRARATTFSWERCANEHLRVFDRALADREARS